MYLKTVLKYIRRSPYQAIAATSIMSFTFFIITLFAVLAILSVGVINYFEAKPQLTIFFKDQATQADISQLKSQLEHTGEVSSIQYVSKSDALKIYQEQNKNDPILLDLVTADILPASFEIQAKSAEYLSELSSLAEKSPIVDQVVFQKDIVTTLVLWTNSIRKVGAGIIAFLALESVIVILTIIAFKITVKREEIEIMKLIGANNWFIRMPFVIEASVYGFMGAFIGWVIGYGFLVYFSPLLNGFLKGIIVLPLTFPIMLELLGLEIVVATCLGGFGGFLAVLRYLK